ncbi:DUF916 and DUF3324 domain-containing protein [Vagococcus sp. BWB3-3]|uniref:DUF916 and DUF3324 domain-containing protein n=1 Tax=Vagococcus allomyrinae TaxID=2794353 RepID=A0A940PA70_9ENTE|nr:DUF916 and DUF3324 domain-containing protein [Vagococcus allomyrinae]MBP1042451.1 DUF916 and DUF3324 domain-containing protein [Vagococcus allomyrinae]
MRRKQMMSNTRRWKIICISFLVMFLWMSSAGAVHAEDDTLGYTVDIIKPETQIDTTKDYFNIQTRPGEVQTIQAVVKSLRKEPVTVKIFAENAMTSEAGQINYSDNKAILDKSLTLPISDMVSIKTPEVTVANLEEKIIEIQVTPPQESYEGVKLGDIAFQLQDDSSDKESGVGSLFAYRIGLLTMEEDMDYRDSKTLKLAKVTPDIHRGKKTVLLRFQNPEPKILSNFELAYTLTKKGSKEPLKKEVSKNHNMAPNSNYNFAIDLGMDQVSAGEYQLKAEVTNSYGSWDFDETFKVSDSQAQKMNEETAFKLATPSWIKYTAIAMTALSVILTVIVAVRQSKWKKMIKALKKKRKRGRK